MTPPVKTSGIADPLLTIDEVAAELRQQTSTLYGWRARKVGPKAFKVGRRLLYRRSQLDAWLDSCGGADTP